MASSVRPFSIQLTLGVTAFVLVLIVAAAVYVLLRWARAHGSRGARIVAAVSVAVAVLMSPLVFDATIARIFGTADVNRVFVDPGWSMKLAPGVIGLLVALLLSARRRATDSS